MLQTHSDFSKGSARSSETVEEPGRADPERASHDRIMAELESHSPEGRGVRPSVVRLERRVLFPLIGAAILGTLAAVYLVAGAIGVAIAAVFMVVYYVIGWWPELAAARIRRKEHDAFEHDIATKPHSDGDRSRIRPSD
jgi:hypothetical protein